VALDATPAAPARPAAETFSRWRRLRSTLAFSLSGTLEIAPNLR
jgi:hypothetical protein